jgi:alkyl sulfatase BDS1-like metallo-beta-lactamase superfamily hydrolase
VVYEYKNLSLRRYQGPDHCETAVGDRGQVASKVLLEARKRIGPEAVRAGNRIHSIVGLGISATQVIEADDGLIVVDTGLSVSEGDAKMRMIRTFSSKPVRAVIYTHFHYSNGTTAFLPADGKCEIYAHQNCDANRSEETASVAPAKRYRLIAQAGRILPDTGPDADSAGTVESHPGPPGYAPPTRTFREHGEVLSICGVRMTVFTEYPFDTNCTILIWLPDDETIIHNHMSVNFPNVYSIGGCRFRDPQPWLAGLDEIRRRQPEHLLGCHGRPIHGRRAVARAVAITRDALQFVFDQTVRGINQGLRPGELIDAVRLPPQLAEHPMLLQTYGEVWHHVREIYSGLLGWYDGNAAELIPMHPDHEARRIVEAMGGAAAAVAAAESAFTAGDLAWSARLCNYVLCVESSPRARGLQARTLREAAYRTTAWGTRNALLTQALELEGRTRRPAPAGIPGATTLLQSPEGASLEYLRYRVNPQRAGDVSFILAVRFEQTGRTYTAVLRNGVLDTSDAQPNDEGPRITVVCTRAAWIERLVSGHRLPHESSELTRALQVFDLPT